MAWFQALGGVRGVRQVPTTQLPSLDDLGINTDKRHRFPLRYHQFCGLALLSIQLQLQGYQSNRLASMNQILAILSPDDRVHFMRILRKMRDVLEAKLHKS